MWTALDAKLVGILLISVGTLLFGLLPSALGLGSGCTHSVTISSVLCFGGGVLLSTSLVHILPEARESLFQWAEIVLCLGYFLLYFVDVLHHLLNGSRETDKNLEDESLIRSQSCRNYDSIERNEQVPGVSVKRHQYTEENYIPKINLTAANIGLLIAFSVHSLLEGLVVGVQSTPSSVMLLVGAVSCHKLVVAFCLGAELSADGRPFYSIIPPLSVYTVGSALGIAIGTFLHSGTTPEDNIVVPVFQALAGGTLLYIVLSEILPRERSKDLPSYAAFIQFVSLLIGFILIALLNYYV